MARALDTASLTAPISRDEVRAYRARAGSGTSLGSVLVSVGGVVAALIWLLVSFGAIGSVANGGASAGRLVIPIVGFLVIIGIVVATVVGGIAKSSRRARLDRFARANGMTFSVDDAGGGYAGAIFQTGGSRTLVEHLTATAPRFLDYGTYTYVTGSGKNRTTHDWGYLALRLDRRLPHMVLDSRANNGLFGGTNLPETFARDQVLHLEGDFDKYFTLYCPSDYERDALYVFTPDLMALLIDESSAYDVEIVDDWMFVYSSERFDLTDPAVHQRLLGIVDTVGAKTLSQTERYEDDHAGVAPHSDIVAPAGRRLRRGTPVLAIVIVVAFAGFWIWSLASGMGH